METLVFLWALCLYISISHAGFPSPASSDLNASCRLSAGDVTASVYSESDPAPASLFGAARNLKASSEDLLPGVHPRVAFNAGEWARIVDDYAKNRLVENTWSKYFMRFIMDRGPNNPVLQHFSTLDTSSYTGEPDMNKAALKILAKELENMSDLQEGGIFMYALHVAVNSRVVETGGAAYLGPEHNVGAAINMVVNIAKVVLSHYAVYGCEKCQKIDGIRFSGLWDLTRAFEIYHSWGLGMLGMALSYDVLHKDMSATQRRFVNSALGLMVKGREHWGIAETSDRYMPNVLEHPHRIYSNWAIYHANLYLANLAIEGETDFDRMTRDLGVGFNTNVNEKVPVLFKAYMQHAINPDGSSFEDGYTFNLAFREGSLGFIALARRGQNHLDTPRGRNMIHYVAQSYEPYRCGNFVGHSSGGGLLYHTFQALFLYAYPNGELPGMLWRQRMGAEFKNNKPCRITYHQNMVQMAILASNGAFTAESPSELSTQIASDFPKSAFFPRRGLLICRSDMSKEALYLHFDARPDAFYPGHDNADRGVITLTALGRPWLDDLSWSDFKRSQEHSLMHIDGQAQALKAPSVRMIKAKDEAGVVLAAADLTYAYNVQWSRAWQTDTEPTLDEEIFENGAPTTQRIRYTDQELASPTAFGWPDNDPGTDIGFNSTTQLWGEPDIGFRGLYNWKRDYRTVSLRHGVRSTVLVRGGPGESYVLLGDDFAMKGSATHKFSSHLILAQGVTVASSSSCAGGKCTIMLTDDVNRFVTVLVAATGQTLSYAVDRLKVGSFETNRLIVTSAGMTAEQMCIGFQPHIGSAPEFELTKDGSTCAVKCGDELKRFRFRANDHSLELVGASPTPLPTSSPSVSASPSYSPSPTASTTPTASASPSPSRVASTLLDPMDPVRLPYRSLQKLTYDQLSHNPAIFYDPSVPHSQATFWFDTVHNSKRVLTTCRWYTNTDTVMWLYDCGATVTFLAKYYERKCKLVKQGDDECWRQRTKIEHAKVSTGSTKTYVLVVGAKGVLKKGARIGLEHR